MDYTQNLSLPQWEADDRIMRTDFNDAMAAIDAGVAERCKVITGTYTGDGSSSRIISLGVTPKAVIVRKGRTFSNTQVDSNDIKDIPMIAVTGGATAVLSIVDGGFRINQHTFVNEKFLTYFYIAFA